ncbi:MAG TPA: GDSL-type esterase/lipase family protein [Polyangiaceae bacterium]
MNFRASNYVAGTYLALFLSACSGGESSNPAQGGNSNATSIGGAASGGASSSAKGGATSAVGGSNSSNATGGSRATEATTASGGSGTTAMGGTSTAAGGSSNPPAGGASTMAGGSGTKATGGASTAAGGSGTKVTTGGTTSAGGTSAVATGGSSVSTANRGGANAGGTSAGAGTNSVAGSSSTGTQHWVGTWTAAPYVDTNTNNTPPIPLSNAVVRQVTHVSLGGSQIRVQFSNLRGNGALTINSAHIALCKATPLVDSTIDTATDKALAFSGKANVTVAQGQEVWSDAIDFTVPNQGNITITTAFGSVPSTLTQHSGSRTTSYFQASSTDVSAANMSSAQKKVLWFFISGIDVMADADAKGIVAIGDSITDGRGTTNDGNNRWTDILAARLQANAATAKVSMMNQGIGATNLAGTGDTTGQARYARDVLGRSGVKYVIVYHGVNDIGSSGTQFQAMKTAYDDLISRGHAKGLLVFGGTILPFNGNSYYDAAGQHEAVRKQVNEYIRSGAFDGVIDFDAALKDPADPTKLLAAYADWAEKDGLHPGPAGYQKMGETPDLALFTK